MTTPTRVVVNNARGESFADVARRLGAIGDITILSSYSDAEVMTALSSNLAEIVAAAGYTVIAAVATATSALNGDGNITLSGEQTIAGVLTSTSRVLLTDQTSPAENGIWVTAAGSWTRATDFDETSEVVQGSYVSVTGGNNAGALVLTTADPITVGTTGQTWRLWRLDQTLALIADLASSASGKGLSLIGTQNFSGATIPDGSNGQEAVQSLETALELIDADVEILRAGGDAGLAVLAAFGSNEARAAIGLVEQRKGNLTTAGDSYIVNANDIFPGTVHYSQLSGAGEVYFDVSALRDYEPFLFINGSSFGGNMILDCGADMHFRGGHINPSLTTTTTIKLRASEWCILVKYGGNRIQVIQSPRMSFWATGSGSGYSYKYRFLADETIELIYTRTSSIPATTESTANNIPTTMDLSSAQVLSVQVNPDGSGTAPLDYPLQVTKLGTTHSLNAYQFAIRNPNGSNNTHPVTVHFIGITEV